jgi:Zn-dependent protease
MSFESLLLPFIGFVVLIFSIILHEVAHGYVAYRLGDLTAKLDGRLTLNPIPHIDPVGTIALPLIFAVLQSPVAFGWAKPVPVNYYNLRGGERDYFWVAFAGIAVNLTLAVIGAVIYRLLLPALGLHGDALNGSLPFYQLILLYVLTSMILYNILLALFNLIPIPPLDGSRLIRTILPREYQEMLDQLEPYGFVILFGFLFFFQDRLASAVQAVFKILIGA